MKPLTETQEENILTLCDFWSRQGAEQGLAISHEETARQLEWPDHRLAQTIRVIKEHPELNVGVACRRGPNPLVILALDNAKISGDTLIEDKRIVRAGMLEGVQRLARYYAQTRVGYANVLDKRSYDGRRLLNEKRKQELSLRALQSTLDLADETEAEIAEFIDSVLDGAAV